MKENKSFEKYLHDRYYNEIHRAVTGFVYQRGKQLDIRSHIVMEADYFHVEDFRIRSVIFKKGVGDQLNFTATVMTEIAVRGRGRKDYEEDSDELWLSVGFTGRLSNGLSNVNIVSVDEYSKEKFVKEEWLSHLLVPYISADQLDDYAEAFLRKYCYRAIESPMPLPIDEILGVMRLKKFYAPLPDNVFGRTYFKSPAEEIEVFSDDMTKQYRTAITAGTILVNPFVFFMRNVGSQNNTIIHECVHWELHRRFFELQKLLNTESDCISCEAVEKYDKADGETESAINWMEWQANAIAPRILMPKKAAKIKITETMRQVRNRHPHDKESIIMEEVITEVAEFFNVSYVAAKIRAIDLGYDIAEGTKVFVDGRYLPPFSFKRGVLKRNQTFIVDLRSAVIESTINPHLAEMVNSGSVVYANCMYCLNDPKYIEKNENGTPILTEYALEHVDECCFVFDRHNRVNKSYDDSYYRECFLCRDIDSTTAVEASYNEDYEDNQNKKKRADEIKKTREGFADIMEVMKKLPHDFPETLSYHIKRKKLTNEELAYRSKISAKSIGQYRREEANIQKPRVMALCIGLNLYPDFCYDLLEKAGHTLRAIPEDMAYRFLINGHTDENIDEWNRTLTELGIEQQLPGN